MELVAADRLVRKKPAPVRFIARLLLGLNGLLRKTLVVNIGKTLFRQVHARFGPRFRRFGGPRGAGMRSTASSLRGWSARSCVRRPKPIVTPWRGGCRWPT